MPGERVHHLHAIYFPMAAKRKDVREHEWGGWEVYKGREAKKKGSDKNVFSSLSHLGAPLHGGDEERGASPVVPVLHVGAAFGQRVDDGSVAVVRGGREGCPSVVLHDTRGKREGCGDER